MVCYWLEFGAQLRVAELLLGYLQDCRKSLVSTFPEINLLRNL
jgi:hypothetical protein